MERAASVVDSGAYPPVVGHEIMQALLDTRCVPEAVLAAARAGQRFEVDQLVRLLVDAGQEPRRPPAAPDRISGPGRSATTPSP